MTIIKAKNRDHLNAMLDRNDVHPYLVKDLDSICDSDNIFVYHCGVLFDTGFIYECDLWDRMAANGYTE